MIYRTRPINLIYLRI